MNRRLQQHLDGSHFARRVVAPALPQTIPLGLAAHEAKVRITRLAGHVLALLLWYTPVNVPRTLDITHLVLYEQMTVDTSTDAGHIVHLVDRL